MYIDLHLGRMHGVSLEILEIKCGMLVSLRMPLFNILRYPIQAEQIDHDQQDQSQEGKLEYEQLSDTCQGKP